MADFPDSPLTPAEFLEQWLPQAFAEAEIPDDARNVDVRVGVCLHGDGGGEWIFEVTAGTLAVTPGSRDECAFTFVQTVEDWRGALWEGRGGAIGRQSVALFKPGSQAAAAAPGQMGPGPPNAAALEEMRKLDGVIRMCVTGAEGGDWAVGFKLGPGPIPEEPTTIVSITAEDAAALESGELDPMQAFMGGKLQVQGDMTLMMQMQAIQMQAAAAAAAPPPTSEES